MVNSIKGYNSYRNFGYLYKFVEKYRPIFYIKFINLLINLFIRVNYEPARSSDLMIRDLCSEVPI